VYESNLATQTWGERYFRGQTRKTEYIAEIPLVWIGWPATDLHEMPTHDNTDLTTVTCGVHIARNDEMAPRPWRGHTERQGSWLTVPHPLRGESCRRICSTYVRTWIPCSYQVPRHYCPNLQASAFLRFPNPLLPTMVSVHRARTGHKTSASVALSSRREKSDR
jgi:hypothetical protein